MADYGAGARPERLHGRAWTWSGTFGADRLPAMSSGQLGLQSVALGSTSAVIRNISAGSVAFDRILPLRGGGKPLIWRLTR